jgi:hypothetical protein
MLAYIANTFHDVDVGLKAQQPWKLKWWNQSRVIRGEFSFYQISKILVLINIK